MDIHKLHDLDDLNDSVDAEDPNGIDDDLLPDGIEMVTEQLANAGTVGLSAAAAIQSSARWFTDDHSYVADFTSSNVVSGGDNSGRSLGQDVVSETISGPCLQEHSNLEERRRLVFVVDPAARRRLTTRLLRKIRFLIDQMSVKCGQQVSLVVAVPQAQGVNAKNNFRVFGSEPLCSLLRRRKEEVMRDLCDTLEAMQADLRQLKTESRSSISPEDDMLDRDFVSFGGDGLNQSDLNPTTSVDAHTDTYGAENDSSHSNGPPYLPQPQVNGIPTALDKMTASELRNFVPFMLKFSLGRGKPGWGKRSMQPPWWPTDIIPWANVRTDARTQDQKDSTGLCYTEALRHIVLACYRYHGQVHMLNPYTVSQSSGRSTDTNGLRYKSKSVADSFIGSDLVSRVTSGQRHSSTLTSEAYGSLGDCRLQDDLGMDVADEGVTVDESLQGSGSGFNFVHGLSQSQGNGDTSLLCAGSGDPDVSAVGQVGAHQLLLEEGDLAAMALANEDVDRGGSGANTLPDTADVNDLQQMCMLDGSIVLPQTSSGPKIRVIRLAKSSNERQPSSTTMTVPRLFLHGRRLLTLSTLLPSQILPNEGHLMDPKFDGHQRFGE